MAILRSTPHNKPGLQKPIPSSSSPSSSASSAGSVTSSKPQSARKTKSRSPKSPTQRRPAPTASLPPLVSAIKVNLDNIILKVADSVYIGKNDFLLKALTFALTPDTGYRFCCEDRHGLEVYDKEMLGEALTAYTNFYPSSDAEGTFMKGNQLYFETGHQCPRVSQDSSSEQCPLFYKLLYSVPQDRFDLFLKMPLKANYEGGVHCNTRSRKGKGKGKANGKGKKKQLVDDSDSDSEGEWECESEDESEDEEDFDVSDVEDSARSTFMHNPGTMLSPATIRKAKRIARTPEPPAPPKLTAETETLAQRTERIAVSPPQANTLPRYKYVFTRGPLATSRLVSMPLSPLKNAQKCVPIGYRESGIRSTLR